MEWSHGLATVGAAAPWALDIFRALSKAPRTWPDRLDRFVSQGNTNGCALQYSIRCVAVCAAGLLFLQSHVVVKLYKDAGMCALFVEPGIHALFLGSGRAVPDYVLFLPGGTPVDKASSGLSWFTYSACLQIRVFVAPLYGRNYLQCLSPVIVAPL